MGRLLEGKTNEQVLQLRFVVGGGGSRIRDDGRARQQSEASNACFVSVRIKQTLSLKTTFCYDNVHINVYLKVPPPTDTGISRLCMPSSKHVIRASMSHFQEELALDGALE